MEEAYAEEREYPDAADQIREVLIHENYFSQEDIDVCLGLDITSLSSHPQYDNVHKLHETLKAVYGADNERYAS